jgi:RNA polymerase sigma factor (sigma-70 family)
MMIQNKKEDFLKLIAAHKPIIYKICNSYCKNQYDRDDLAQEITYQLWKSYTHFNGTVKFTTWMYRVALNVAITFYRKTKTAEAIIKLAEPDLEIEDKKNDTIELEKNINTLQQFINQLKELDKALMILYLEEKSYSEIAEVLGITETNVATKIGRIKDKLKQKFSTINN